MVIIKSKNKGYHYRLISIFIIVILPILLVHIGSAQSNAVGSDEPAEGKGGLTVYEEPSDEICMPCLSVQEEPNGTFQEEFNKTVPETEEEPSIVSDRNDNTSLTVQEDPSETVQESEEELPISSDLNDDVVSAVPAKDEGLTVQESKKGQTPGFLEIESLLIVLCVYLIFKSSKTE